MAVHASKAIKLGEGMKHTNWAAPMLVLALASCGAEPSSDIQNVEVIAPESVVSPSVPAEPPTAWRYTSELDPMTDRPTHLACTTSTNEVRLQWPYSDVGARLCIRQSPQHGLDVFVALLGDGQIICRSYRDCSVKIRFGDGEQQSFSAAKAADGSSNIIFVTNGSRFVAAAKSAPITRVQMTFYNAGDQVIEFATADLEWPRPAT